MSSSAAVSQMRFLVNQNPWVPAAKTSMPMMADDDDHDERCSQPSSPISSSSVLKMNMNGKMAVRMS
jgi:hypothetical protein